ncbi:hypothetical protein ACIA8C_01285 [Nocardia sp. NPDC051321]|uniref:hypothetical protein n=1 Tax=Nocardia sp. NPDC051321 TaxID=3364323 RepID=UPI0037924EE6
MAVEASSAAAPIRVAGGFGGTVAGHFPPGPDSEDRYRTDPIWWDNRSRWAIADELRGSPIQLGRHGRRASDTDPGLVG